MEKGRKKIHYAWFILAGCCIMQGASLGLINNCSGVFYSPVCQDLGFEMTVDEESCIVTVEGLGGKLPCEEAVLNVGSAGTAARFLTATLGVSEGVFHMDSSEQMKRRPMDPLLSSLAELGCEVRCEGEDGHFPFTLTAHGFGQDHISIDIGHSSQFLSALLIASTLSSEDFTIQVEGTHGMAYIEMTQKMMEQFGVCVERPMPDQFRIPAGQHYKALDYQIEPDVSAACYFYAMVPLLGIPVCVEHVHFESLQGDVEFLRILEKMGCTAQDTEKGVLLLPPSALSDAGTQAPAFHGITVDMSSCSDQAITLAAIAPFADSPTCITGIGHIRFQESDRIHAICTELTHMGIHCEETQDSITIYPGTPKPCTVATYDDHRMAMSLALAACAGVTVTVNDPGCTAKTYPDYFEAFGRLTAHR